MILIDKLIKYLSTSIDFDCIFFFDEYEKEFKNSSDVLSFMDGTYNSIYRKVFLLTTNELNVDPNLLGRPSRIRYKKSFSNLSEEVTREILNDILEDKTAIKSGFANSGKQMLRCKECGKRFVVDRGQLTFYSHQDQSKWNELILDTLNGVSLKETAAKINVNERNVFNMRHKLLVSLGTEERPIQSR